MAYAEVPDVTALNTFPLVGTSTATSGKKVPTETIESWLKMRSSELDLSLRLKGFETPITAPPELLDLLKMAVTYGAAAMLERAPKIKQGDAEVNAYLQEYLRIKNWIEARSRDELLGANLLQGVTTSPSPPGLSLARQTPHHKRVSIPWYDAYPVRRVE